MQQAIRQYLKEVEADLAQGQATEHTHRPTLKTLLEACAPHVTAINEPKRIACGAPDLVVLRDNLTVGYVEAKDVGRPLDDVARSEQLKRYRAALNNLILTDYVSFIWFVDGEERERARIATVTGGGELKARDRGVEQLTTILGEFLAKQPVDITSPHDLAERMASLTHLIRDIVIEAFRKDEASPMLSDLRLAMAQSLIPDLDEPEQLDEFADMYAQTLAYGLFAARANFYGPGEFRRGIAAASIPRTNPFLRRLFTAITGPDLNDEPYAGFVEDLVQLLNHVDIDRILAQFGKRTRREDPVVHFYETFLTKYDPQLREARGVYYTPEPVVSYIVRSVDHILKTRFDLPGGLADESKVTYTRTKADGTEVTEEAPQVLILDPATGTATFLYYVVDLIREQFMQGQNAGMWPGYVRNYLLPRLFGFELLMAPYAVAHLKLGLQLDGQDLPEPLRKRWRYDFQTDDRLGIYLTNTLEEAEKEIQTLYGPFRAISEEGKAAARVKRDKPIMVVIGNPPYSNYGQMNRNPWILGLLETYKKGLVEKKLNLDDDFIKFIRWGQWRIEQSGQGVLAFITNHVFLNGITHRRMRQSLMETFDEIYIFDLHGHSRIGEVTPDGKPDENVFDIQQGVAISLFVKLPNSAGKCRVFHNEIWGRRDYKYQVLLENSISSTSWQPLEQVDRKTCLGNFYFFTPKGFEHIDEYCKGWSVEDVFPVSQNGIKTDRDALFLDFERDDLANKIQQFYSATGLEHEFREKYNIYDSSSYNLLERRNQTDYSPENIKRFLYRPYNYRWIYYRPGLTSRPAWGVMRHVLAGENLAFITTRQTREKWDVVVTDVISGHKSCAAYDINTVFPLYRYSDPNETAGTLFEETEPVRTPNLKSEFVNEFSAKLNLDFQSYGRGDLKTTFGPEDIFYYICAIFHSPTYRERYAEFLQIAYPRVPIMSDLGLFTTLADFGEQLTALHLMNSQKLQFTNIVTYPISGDNEVASRHPRYLPPKEPEPGTGEPLEEGRVYINPEQYFGGIEPGVWEFQVGGYQVLDKWLKDRKGRELSYEEIKHYQRVVVALRETMRLMAAIDEAIVEWPIE